MSEPKDAKPKGQAKPGKDGTENGSPTYGEKMKAKKIARKAARKMKK
jgi:hypothetical protein